jgi:hypothetical protein
MQSSEKKQLERKFLSTEMPFQTPIIVHHSSASRFPKLLEMYTYSVHQSNGGATVHDWDILNVKEFRKVAKMYFERYKIVSR